MDKRKIADIVIIVVCAALFIVRIISPVQTTVTGAMGLFIQWGAPVAFLVVGAGFVLRLAKGEKIFPLANKIINCGVVIYALSLVASMQM